MDATGVAPDRGLDAATPTLLAACDLTGPVSPVVSAPKPSPARDGACGASGSPVRVPSPSARLTLQRARPSPHSVAEAVGVGPVRGGPRTAPTGARHRAQTARRGYPPAWAGEPRSRPPAKRLTTAPLRGPCSTTLAPSLGQSRRRRKSSLEGSARAARKLDQYAARKVDHQQGVHSTRF